MKYIYGYKFKVTIIFKLVGFYCICMDCFPTMWYWQPGFLRKAKGPEGSGGGAASAASPSEELLDPETTPEQINTTLNLSI